MGELCRRVGAHLVFDVERPAYAVLQVAASSAGASVLEEELTIRCNGQLVVAPEMAMPHGGRAHVFDVTVGRFTVDYRAAVVGRTDVPSVSQADRIQYLRPSRYAESDRLTPTAQGEFAGLIGGSQLLAAVSSWVGSRLSYVPGSSLPTSGAVDTLLQREGVCRDYAHLAIALLRAMDIPARLASVYAPGLTPMDFHAVAEALIDGTWRVVDPTLLAPRASLVRIATGRDASDTSFLSTYGGFVTLEELEVTAITDGPLPEEDVNALVSLG